MRELNKKLFCAFLAFALVLGNTSVPGVSAAKKLKLNKVKLTLQVGNTAQLTVKGIKGKLKWSSSKPKVAKVTQKGKITAKKAGKAVIKVKVKKKTFKCNVTVKKVKTATATASPASTSSALSENWSATSANAQKIREYVKETTDESNTAKFIPKKDRIAVFDMDGTLMCETYPAYYDTTMFVKYALYDHPEKVTDDVKAIAKYAEGKTNSEIKDYTSEQLAEAFAKAYKGLTVKEFYTYVQTFGENNVSRFNNMKFKEAFFRPMVELVKYLYENDFTIYVVSGTERTTTRAIVANSPLANYINENNVIGTEFEIRVKGHETETSTSGYQYDAGADLVYTGNFVSKNLKASKVINIEQEIGKQPVLCFGNSSGDFGMCNYTITNNKYPAQAYLLVADDAEREWGNASNWETLSAKYTPLGYNAISMKNEFKNMFGDNVILKK